MRKMSYQMILMLLLAWAFFCPGLAADAGLKDDAFHYLHNGIDDRLYNEWWYFNGVSENEQFFFSYTISDPENITGFRAIRTSAAVMEGDKPPVVGVHYSRGYGADRNMPNLDIDNSGFSALNESAYHAWGNTQDVVTGSPLKWDLTFRAAASPWFGSPVQTRVGHLPNDWMKWLVYMPSAWVTGTLTWNNQTHDISAIGFHDHNWGRWAFNDPRWNWAQVSSPEEGFSLALGNVIGEQRNTIVGINYAGELIEFKNKQIKLSYQDFALDPLTARTYPVAYQVTAGNSDYQLDMNIAVLKNVPLLASYPWPMPSYVIFEQVSEFNGTLRSRGGEIYQFRETGFSEYTTHQLHPLFGRFNVEGAANITITATNERTGQTKVAEPSSAGWFSFDATFEDYLQNSTEPWVADGDIVRLEAGDAAGRKGSVEVAVNLKDSRQEVSLLEL